MYLYFGVLFLVHVSVTSYNSPSYYLNSRKKDNLIIEEPVRQNEVV